MTWGRIGSVPPRSGHTCTRLTLSDGTEALVLFGGHEGVDVLQDTHLLLPHEHRWRRLEPSGTPPAPRALHSACVLHGQLPVFAGWGGHGTTHADLCALSIDARRQSSRWTRLVAPRAPVPAARQGHSAVASADDEMLVFGGDTGGVMSAELWAMHTRSGLWSLEVASGAAPPPRSGHASGVLQAPSSDGIFDRAYMVVYGGRGANGRCMHDLFLLCLESRVWSTPAVGGDVPRPLWSAACCTLNGVLIVDGGRDEEGCLGLQQRFELVRRSIEREGQV